MSQSRIEFTGMTRNTLESELDYHLERLDLDGFTVIHDVLDAATCQLVRDKLDAANDRQIERYGRERLNQLKDYGVIRDLLVDDPFFQELVLLPVVWDFVGRIVGPTAILHLQNGIVLEPNLKHFQAFYHRDFAKDFVADKVLALNAMFAVDPFSAETGGTWVVPGTHRVSRLPSQRYMDEHAVQIEAPAGSLFLFDGLLLHKAGDNRSGAPRRAVNHQFTRPFIKQQLDYAGMFRGKLEPESRFAQVIGTWTMPPRDVAEYRVDPDKRTYRGGQG